MFVDYNILALKKLQTENDLVIIVISLLNRQKYLTRISCSLWTLVIVSSQPETSTI